MNEKDISRNKSLFENAINKFISELQDYIQTSDKEWKVKGFIDSEKNIFTLSNDTKILSKIIEIYIFPKLLDFAKLNNYDIILAEHQNWYPDVTLISKSNTEIKFALDIKTSYRKSENEVNGFTLGSHGRYFKDRNSTKNIQYAYNEYLGHYCLGIIYSRQDDVNNFQIKQIDDLSSIRSVIKNFDFFCQEKWKIASDKQGSGNTANIGSIRNIKNLKSGNGIFNGLGEKLFDDYWMNFGNITAIKNSKTIKIKSIYDYLEYKNREDLLLNLKEQSLHLGVESE